MPCADFSREASSLENAALSAIADLESVDGIEVIRIADAGLVSISDIAARTGRTGESVRLLVEGKRGPGGFPAPVTDPRRRRNRLWYWPEVARWFESTGTGRAADDQGQILAAIQRLARAEAPAQDRRAGALGSVAGALRPDPQ